MSAQRTVRIFISSPSDVRPERLRAEQVVARLNREFAYHFHVEAVLWEREPLVASHHFQDENNIPRPSASDIVVVLLWARLGVLLPKDRFRGAISGRSVTGTEWEFEDALASARERGVPDVMLYRKTARITADLDDEVVLEERRLQRALVQDFVARWFRSDDGGYRAASHSFASTTEFEELLYEHLRELLRRRTDAAMEGPEIRWHQPPFRGLLAFGSEHAPIFFGRARARNELRELIARQDARGSAFVLVLGASGSGKSSLVRAGLVPDLMLPGMIGRVALVRCAIFRPSDASASLMGGLASALIAEQVLPELIAQGFVAEQLAALLRQAPPQAMVPIKQALLRAGRACGIAESADTRLLLVIDQLEELFTLQRFDRADRTMLVAALEAIAGSGTAWVVATMRSDFYDRLEAVPEIAHLAGSDACYRLRPPDDVEIGQIIRQPAQEAGLSFDYDHVSGRSLDEELRSAAQADSGNVLPLLEFTLEQLWQQRTNRGLLTFDTYRRLGGLRGAIGNRAEEIFLAQPIELRDALPQLIFALAAAEPGGTGRVFARSADLDALPAGSLVRRLAEAFLVPEARLLVADASGGRTLIRLAHEALLSHWPRAYALVEQQRNDLAVRQRLELALQRWEAAGSKDQRSLLLPGGLPLSEAEALLGRQRGNLSPALVAFIEASSAYDRRKLRRLRVTAGALAMLAVVAMLGAWFGLSGQRAAERQSIIAHERAVEAEQQAREAQRARLEAEQQTREAQTQRAQALTSQSLVLANLARTQADYGNGRISLRLAFEALPSDLSRPNRPLVPQAQTALAYALEHNRDIGVLRAGDNVITAAFSPDGHRIVTGEANKTAKIWDTDSGRLLAELGGHDDIVYRAFFNQEGNRVVTLSSSRVGLWDASTGQLEAKAELRGTVITSGAFTLDGRYLVTSEWDNTVRIWDARNLSAVAVVNGPEECCRQTMSPNNTIQLALAHQLWRLFHSFQDLVLSPDGTRVVATSNFNVPLPPQIWSVPEGKPIASMDYGGIHGVGNGFYDVSFDPSGTRVLAAGGDGVAYVWNATDGSLLHALHGHSGQVIAASFSPDGTEIVTGSADHTARVWDAETGALLHILRGHDAAVNVARFSPSGDLIMTGAGDGTIRLWNADDGSLHGILRGHTDLIQTASFSPDGSEILSASKDGTARLWRTEVRQSSVAVRPSMTEEEVRLADPGITLAAQPNGRILFSRTQDAASVLIDGTSHRVIGKLMGSAPSFLGGSGVVATLVGARSRLWNGLSGSPIAELPGRIIAANAAGDRAVASEGARFQLVETTTGRTIKQLDVGRVDLVLFTPDGQRVVIAVGDQGLLFDGRSGDRIAVFPGSGSGSPIERFAIDRAGVVLGIGWRGGQAQLVRLADGMMVSELKSGDTGVADFAFSDDGKRLLTQLRDNSAELRDTDKGAVIARFPSSNPLIVIGRASPTAPPLETSTMAETLVSQEWTSSQNPFVPGHNLILAQDGQMFGANDGQPVIHITDPSAGMFPTLLSYAFSSVDSRQLILGLQWGPAVWDIETRQYIAQSDRNNQYFETLKRVLSAAGHNVLEFLNGSVYVWAHKDWSQAVQIAPPTAIGPASQLPDTRLIGEKNAILLHLARTATLLDSTGTKTLTDFGSKDDPIAALTVSDAGRFIVTASVTGTLRFWSENGNPIGQPLRLPPKQPPGSLPGSGVEGTGFTPDGGRLVVVTRGMPDKLGYVADIRSGAILDSSVVDASHNATLALTAGAGKPTPERPDLTITDPASGTALGHVELPVRVNVGWLPPLRMVGPGSTPIAFVKPDDTVSLWDRASGTQIGKPMVQSDHVTALAFSVDGKQLVVGARDGSVRVWDTQKATLLYEAQLAQAMIAELEISPDGQLIVARALDGSASIWRAANNTRLRIEDLVVADPNRMRAMIFAPDGRFLAARSRSGFVVIDAESGKTTLRFPPQQGPGIRSTLAFDPTGRWLAVQDDGTLLQLWPVGGPSSTIRALPTYARFEKFAADGTQLLASLGDTMAVFDLGQNLQVPLRQTASANTSSRSWWFANETRALQQGESGKLYLWNMATAELVATIDTHDQHIQVAVSPDEGRFVTWSFEDGTASSYSAIDGREMFHFPIRQANELAFDQSGRHLLVSSGDSHTSKYEIAVLDASTGTALSRIHTHLLGVGTEVDSGSGLRVLLYDGTYLDGLTGQQIANFRPEPGPPAPNSVLPHFGHLTTAAFADDGGALILGTDEGAVTLWRRDGNPTVRSLPGQSAAIAETVLAGPVAATLSADGVAKLWDTRSGSLIAKLQHPDGPIGHLAINSSGHRIVTLPGQPIAFTAGPAPIYHARLWAARTGTLVAELPSRDTPSNAIFSPDGRMLVTSGGTPSVDIWNSEAGTHHAGLANGANVSGMAFSAAGDLLLVRAGPNIIVWQQVGQSPTRLDLRAGGGNVRDSAFSQDGKIVAAAYDDGTIRLWSLPSSERVKEFRTGARAPVKVALSRDGSRVAAVMSDGTAAIWATGPLGTLQPDWQAIIDFTDATAGAPLTPDERREFFLPPLTRPSAAMRTARDATQCDELAGDPVDSERRAAGVGLGAIATEKALAACAVQSGTPSSPRQLYELARALESGHRLSDAAATYHAAAKAGYPAAMYVWHKVLAYGLVGVARDEESARTWLQRAAEKGEARAQTELGMLEWRGAGDDTARRRAAVGMLSSAAAAGDEYAAQELGSIAEREGRTEAAAKWYMQARRLAVSHENSLALTTAADRLAFLLRQMSPTRMEEVVEQARNTGPGDK